MFMFAPFSFNSGIIPSISQEGEKKINKFSYEKIQQKN